MGKGMTAKKKNMPLTEAEWSRREKQLRALLDEQIRLKNQELYDKFDKWEQTQKTDITQSTLELAYCLVFVALYERFEFDSEMLADLNETLEGLSDSISAGERTWWDIRDKAEELGFVPANEFGILEERNGDQ